MAAIQAGAGAVYFGIEKLNMRARSSNNFTMDDLKNITTICKEHHVKSYITLNTILYDDEMALMKQIIDAAKLNGVTAIIASDLSAISYGHSVGMEVHISTQCNITNIEAVKFFAQYADVMVTARELTLKQVKSITDYIQEHQIKGPSGNIIRIEVFVHGALCMAVSGRCYISQDVKGFSANRGECLQLCRRSYTARDNEEGFELEMDNPYILSPKDLCTIGFIDKILEAGVTVLKIEGRGRSADYVKTVTHCYYEAVASCIDKTYTKEKIKQWSDQLHTVYNRGFWDGFYLGRKLGERTENYGSQATKVKVYIGKVMNYFSKLGVAEIKIETHDIAIGDQLLIIGPTTGVLEQTTNEIRVHLSTTEKTIKGETCSLPVKETVRRNDKVYKLVDNPAL